MAGVGIDSSGGCIAHDTMLQPRPSTRLGGKNPGRLVMGAGITRLYRHHRAPLAKNSGDCFGPGHRNGAALHPRAVERVDCPPDPFELLAAGRWQLLSPASGDYRRHRRRPAYPVTPGHRFRVRAGALPQCCRHGE